MKMSLTAAGARERLVAAFRQIVRIQNRRPFFYRVQFLRNGSCHSRRPRCSVIPVQIMSESISKFKRLSARLRDTVAEEFPASFEANCDCGCRITGVRKSSWQQCACPNCNAALFLLPSNVYPSTGHIRNDVIGGTFAHRLQVVTTEVLSGWRVRGRASKQFPSVEDIVSETGSEVPEEPNFARTPSRRRLPRISLPTFNPLKTARRILTPFRLLVAGMLLVIGATSILIYREQQQETAHRTWHESTDSITSLLTDRNFATLQSTLGNATRAGRIIGQRGAKWRLVLNLHQETQALVSVCSETLPSLLSDADTGEPLNDFNQRQLESDLLRGTFVVDGYIDPVSSKTGTYVIDMPAIFKRQPVTVTMQLPQFDELLDQAESRRFVFAFRLADVGRPGDRRDLWQLTVDSESFVLLTSKEHCEHLGFPVDSDPALADVLSRQRTFVKNSARWARRSTEPPRQHLAGRENLR